MYLYARNVLRLAISESALENSCAKRYFTSARDTPCAVSDVFAQDDDCDRFLKNMEALPLT